MLSETLATEQLAHSVSAFHTPYRDTGLFGTYLVCPPEKVEDATYECLNEWMRLSNYVSEKEVTRAIARLKGQLLMQLDGTKEKQKERREKKVSHRSKQERSRLQRILGDRC